MASRRKDRAVFSVACSFMLFSGVLYADQLSSTTSRPLADNSQQMPAEAGQLQNQGGFRAYIDPNTGQLTSPTPEQAREAFPPLSPELQNAISTSHEGLKQQEIPGKGVMVDLQGRFQKSAIATVNDSGEVSISHDAGSLGAKQPKPSAVGNHHQQGE